jgi:hypothetical protein
MILESEIFYEFWQHSLSSGISFWDPVNTVMPVITLQVKKKGKKFEKDKE